MFNYLFKDNGSYVCHRPGKLYSHSDFCSNFFSDSDFIFVNKHNESVRVVFPIYMYSYVKCIKLGKSLSDFCEVISIKLLKEHC